MKLSGSPAINLVLAWVIIIPLLSLCACALSQEEQIDRWIADLAIDLHSRELERRAQSMNALVHAGSSAVPQLTETLGSPDEHIRQSAIEILCHIGPDARLAAPRLHKLAHFDGGRPDRTQYMAFEALTLITPDDESVIELAADYIRHGQIHLASHYLETVGPAARPVTTELLQDNLDPSVELLAAFLVTGGTLIEIEQITIRALTADHEIEELQSEMKENIKLYRDEPGRAREANSPLHRQKGYLTDLQAWGRQAIGAHPNQGEQLIRKWQAEIDQLEENHKLYVIANLWRIGEDALPILSTILVKGAWEEQKAAVDSCWGFKDDAVVLVDELHIAASQLSSHSMGALRLLAEYGPKGYPYLVDLAENGNWYCSIKSINVLIRYSDSLGPDVIETLMGLFETKTGGHRFNIYAYFMQNTEYPEAIVQVAPRMQRLADTADEFHADLASAIISHWQIEGIIERSD